MINSSWETKRLQVRDAVFEDVPVLQRLLESIRDTLTLEGKEEITPDEMKRTVLEGTLPPGGTRDRFHLQVVESKESDKSIGFLGVYHGYPTDNVLYISTLVIGRQHQRQGYGSEIIADLFSLSGCRGYEVSRLWVALKNWNALRFWINQGFIHVVKYTGDKTFSMAASAGLELEKRLPK